jgi:TP901 family phage tail tape measure protein
MSTEAFELFGEVGLRTADFDSKIRGVQSDLKKTEGHMKDANGRLRDLEGRFVSTGKAAGQFGNQVEEASERVEKKIASIGPKMRSIGTSMTAGITLPLVAAFGTSIKFAGDLQEAVANISTIKPEIDTSKVFSALNEMQRRVPQSSKQLGDAMYDIFSSMEATQDEALSLTETFARGATGAKTNAQTFGTAIIGVLNTYGLKAQEAGRISDIFFNTVNKGVVTGGELATGLGNVAKSAQVAGVSIEELGGLIAGSTLGGGSAEQNINNLNNLLMKVTTKEAQKELTDLGIKTLDASGKFLPIMQVIGQLKAKLGEFTQEGQAKILQSIFPDAQARTGLVTLMQQLDATNSAIDLNKQKTDSAAKAYEKMSNTINAKMVLLKNSVVASLTSLGAELLPKLEPVINFLSDKIPKAIDFLITGFKSLPQPVQEFIAVLTGLAVVAGPVLAAVGLLATVFAPIAGAIVPVIAAIGGIALAISVLKAAWETNFAGIREVASNVWSAVKSIFMDAYDYIRNRVMAIVNVVTACWDSILATVTPAWEAIKNIIYAALTLIKDTFKIITGALTGDWQKVWDGIVDIIKNVPGYLLKALGKIIETLANFIGLALKAAWEIGKAIFWGIINGIADLASFLWNKLLELPDVILRAAFKVIPAARELGLAIIRGIIDGLKSLFQSLSNAIGSTIKDAIEASKSQSSQAAFSSGAEAGGWWSRGFNSTAQATPPSVANMPFMKGDDNRNVNMSFLKGDGPSSGSPAATSPFGNKSFAGGGVKGKGGGGGGKGGGKSVAEQLAETAVKSAEIELSAAERISNAINSTLQRAQTARGVILEQDKQTQLKQVNDIFAEKTKVLAKERAAAGLIKNDGERVLKLKELAEKEKQIAADKEEEIAKIEAEAATQQLTTKQALGDSLISIMGNKLSAELDLLHSASVQRVLSAEATAREEGRIALAQLALEEDALRLSLAQKSVYSEEYRRLSFKLGEIEDRRGILIEKTNRDIAEGRRNDLRDYRSYTEQLRSLVQGNTETVIQIGRDAIEAMKVHGASKKEILRAEVDNLIQTEALRHERARDAIAKEKQEFEEKKHTHEQYLEFLQTIHDQEALEEERHRRELEKVRDKELENIKSKIKRVADEATGMLGRAIDAGVKGGFREAFRSILTDFAQLLRSLALQLLNSYLIKLLSQVFGIQTGGQQNGQGQQQQSSKGGNIFSSILSSISGVLGSIFGGQKSGVIMNATAGGGGDTSSVIKSLEKSSYSQAKHIDTGTGSTTQAVKTGDGKSHGFLGGILGNTGDSVGLLQSIAQGVREPGWATALKAGVQLGGAYLSSRGGGGGESGGGGGGITSAASGGFISGEGTSTSDSIAARLSNGEFVMRAAAVRKFGVGFFDNLNSLQMPSKFASGGYVSRPHYAMPSHSSPSAQVPHGPMTFNIHVHGVKDANSFRQSEGQIMAGMMTHAARHQQRYK